MARLKNEKDLRELRISGRILAATMKALKEKAAVGVKLSELDDLARELIEKSGARPAFLDYTPEGARRSYPASICASVNETVVHGLPSKYALRAGDLLKLDLGVNYKGYWTDAAVTVGIGQISKAAKKLLEITEKALVLAIAECRPESHLGDIGWAIENYVEKNDLAVVQGLTGHGVGFALHEEPTVYNYGEKGGGMTLKPGLVLAIEPMVALGRGDIKQKPDDSFVTADGSLAAHFEHTVAITKKGPEILTSF